MTAADRSREIAHELQQEAYEDYECGATDRLSKAIEEYMSALLERAFELSEAYPEMRAADFAQDLHMNLHESLYL